MTQPLRNKLRSLAASVGYDIRRSSIYTSAELRFQRLFSLHRFDLVLDVGANSGQFATECRAGGYRGEILSFEPSATAHAALLRASASDPLWNVAPRMALGASSGEIEINIAANSFSSSILPMLDTHLAAAPESSYIEKEKVQLCRLDDALPDIGSGRRIFLKLDVQGYESQVLAGAPQLLSRVLAVQLEMSLTPLYEGELLMLDMCSNMLRHNFELWDLSPGFRDSATGRLLQIDGIFTRPPFSAA
jgi:FkbM family methyltransferase